MTNSNSRVLQFGVTSKKQHAHLPSLANEFAINMKTATFPSSR